ncbi:MAG: hypothetical protein J7639_03530 [Paenibacillaceae bacterium]|nr:hypothetical protein [Paenibacillaceae bacterium]
MTEERTREELFEEYSRLEEETRLFQKVEASKRACRASSGSCTDTATRSTY